jgi:hypothetical protein
MAGKSSFSAAFAPYNVSPEAALDIEVDFGLVLRKYSQK